MNTDKTETEEEIICGLTISDIKKTVDIINENVVKNDPKLADDGLKGFLSALSGDEVEDNTEYLSKLERRYK
jgi:hypothetical protein